MAEIQKEIKKGGKILVTTLTKRLSEELSKYLVDLGIKTRYLHSDIDTLERIQIIHELRGGVFDVLVGINLLREGLDIPEVSLVAILDADKEGFLRSATALIQTCGRAARNVRGRVIMYADKETEAIKTSVGITRVRRKIQEEYNVQHGITPRSTTRERQLLPIMEGVIDEVAKELPAKAGGITGATAAEKEFTLAEIRALIAKHEKEMKQAAKELRFEDASHARDLMRRYQQLELT